MVDLPGADVPLYSLLGANQTAAEMLSFFEAYSDSLPIIIDPDRIIRSCSPRLREALGYGWQADLVNGQTLIDVLILPEYRARHAEMIKQWFARPVMLEMHSRGALPVVCADGRIVRALVKLVPYEVRDRPARPGPPLADAPSYREFGFAFVTLLPKSWERAGVVVAPPYPDAMPGM